MNTGHECDFFTVLLAAFPPNKLLYKLLTSLSFIWLLVSLIVVLIDSYSLGNFIWFTSIVICVDVVRLLFKTLKVVNSFSSSVKVLLSNNV